MNHNTLRFVPMAVGVILIALASRAIALNESTHELVNREAAKNSAVDVIFKNHLGFAEGLLERFSGNSAIRWLELGGRHEDEGDLLKGNARFLRHFHDPLEETWDTAGLQFLRQYESSVRWMQRANQDVDTPDTGNWGWPTARELFHKALTESTPDGREGYFADTLRALGQMMHLVVDASVPEHVRNDIHPLEAILRRLGTRGYGNYEYWVSDQHGASGSADEGAFTSNYLVCPVRCPIGPGPAIFDQPTGDSLAQLRVARLIDANRYTGTDPKVTLAGSIGIAEFANANFFSEDTGRRRLFSRNYPFPDLERLVRAEVPDPAGRITAYFGKGPGDGLPAFPVLAECVLDKASEAAGLPAGARVMCTDEEVWKQVATEMLPRAVGYSAALLDYFFRGRLAAQVEAVLDPVLGRRDALRLANRTPADAMAGAVELLYDAVDGSRVSLDRWPLTLETNAWSDPFPIPPPLPDKPPLEPGRYLLVFRGRLGDEPDAVAAQWVGTSVWRLELSVETWDKDGTLYGLARLAPGPTTAEARWRLTPAALFDGAAGYGYVTDVRALYFKTLEYVYRCGGRDCTPFIEDTLRGDSAYSVLLYRSSPDLLGETATLSVRGFCANLGIASQYAGQQYEVTYTPVTVEVVRFADPPSLAALQGYTFLTLPAVDSVLASVTVPDLFHPVEVPVDLMGALLLGVRLTTLPAGYPPVITPSGVGGFLDNVCFHGILLKYGACLSLANFYEVPNLCSSIAELRFGPNRPPPAPEPGPPGEPEPPALPD